MSSTFYAQPTLFVLFSLSSLPLHVWQPRSPSSTNRPVGCIALDWDALGYTVAKGGEGRRPSLNILFTFQFLSHRQDPDAHTIIVFDWVSMQVFMSNKGHAVCSAATPNPGEKKNIKGRLVSSQDSTLSEKANIERTVYVAATDSLNQIFQSLTLESPPASARGSRT